MTQTIAREPSSIPENSGVQKRDCSSKLLALIVDAEPATRLLLRVAMQKEGFRVIEASNGRACLADFQSHHPDIVLLDTIMPEIDGFRCCAALRRLSQNEALPVLMIVNVVDAISIKRVFDAGATDYVAKPIHWILLRQRVRSLKAMLKKQQTARKVEAARKAKESLLKEIHYRVKNNLHLMTSLLRFQMKETDAVMLSYVFIASELIKWH